MKTKKQPDPAGYDRPWWDPVRARAIASIVLLLLEVLVLVFIGTWTVVGIWKHAVATGWTLRGLLTMLHEQWRGALILGVLLLYRTARDGLDRVKLKNIRVKTIVGDIEMQAADTLRPGTEKQS